MVWEGDESSFQPIAAIYRSNVVAGGWRAPSIAGCQDCQPAVRNVACICMPWSHFRIHDHKCVLLQASEMLWECNSIQSQIPCTSATMAETKLETMFLMTILHMRLLKVWTLVTLTATGMCHIPVDVLYLFQTLCTCSPHSSMLLSSLVWLVGHCLRHIS